MQPAWSFYFDQFEPRLYESGGLRIDVPEVLDDLARDGFSVHSGSACTSDTRRPSHVLTAIGALTHGNLRISLPPGCSVADVRALAAALPVQVQQQRREAGLP